MADSNTTNLIFDSPVPSDLSIETRTPQRVPFAEESLEFHAARLLLLVKLAGGRKGRIVGRTKLAKLDFFVRYPRYLERAAQIKGQQLAETRVVSPESPMIRYKYGPWDSKYYDVFALLVAKGLLDIRSSKEGDIFQLTPKGQYAVTELSRGEFDQLIVRCRLTYQLFGGETGTAIKNFIYQNFPEIVAKNLGEKIENE